MPQTRCNGPIIRSRHGQKCRKQPEKCQALPGIITRPPAYSARHGEKAPPRMDLIGTMDVKLKPFNFAEAAARAGMADVARRVESKARIEPGMGNQAVEPGSFQSSFAQALGDISKAQASAQALQLDSSNGAPAREYLAKRVVELEGDVPPHRVEQEKTRFTRAPLIVGVISVPKPHPRVPVAFEHPLDVDVEVGPHRLGTGVAAPEPAADGGEQKPQ